MMEMIRLLDWLTCSLTRLLKKDEGSSKLCLRCASSLELIFFIEVVEQTEFTFGMTELLNAEMVEMLVEDVTWRSGHHLRLYWALESICSQSRCP